MPVLPGDGPPTTAYQPYVRDGQYGPGTKEATIYLEVKGFKDALQLQYDIATGKGSPFLGDNWVKVNTINSTQRGYYYVEVTFERPPKDADTMMGGAGPDAPAL